MCGSQWREVFAEDDLVDSWFQVYWINSLWINGKKHRITLFQRKTGSEKLFGAVNTTTFMGEMYRMFKESIIIILPG